MLREFEAAARKSYVSPTVFAHLYAVLGEEQATLRWLRRAQQEHSPLLAFAGVAHDFDSVKDAPEFAAMLREIGIPNP